MQSVVPIDPNAGAAPFSGGNVGIGTTSPLDTAQLDVRGSIQSTHVNQGGTLPTISSSVSTAGGTFITWNGLSTTPGETDFINLYRNAGNTTNGGFAFFNMASTTAVATAPLMYIQNSGNVGIGTTSPSAELSVYGSPSFGEIQAIGLSGTNEASVGFFDLGDVSTSKWVIGKNLNSDTTGKFAFYYNNLTRLSIDTSGNVGIGSASPVATLDVNGSIYSHSVNAGSGTTINWATGNVQYTTASCGAFSFSGMKDGGSYTLMVEGTTAGTCSFSNSDSPALTFKLPSNYGATTSGTMTLFNFTRGGSYVFVTWNPGY